jgi:hypothetical protein
MALAEMIRKDYGSEGHDRINVHEEKGVDCGIPDHHPECGTSLFFVKAPDDHDEFLIEGRFLLLRVFLKRSSSKAYGSWTISWNALRGFRYLRYDRGV